jgi:tricarballylate dehydrogenase
VSERYDVLVVGGGNAGYCAAHAASELVGRVLLLEKAPREWAGGNSYFAAGVFRMPLRGLDEVLELVEDRDDPRVAASDLPAYSEEQFLSDLERVTGGRSDSELGRILVSGAVPTVRWLRGKGLRFRLAFDRQSFLVDGRYRFWGGLYVGTLDGGKGLIRQHLQLAEDEGIETRYEHAVVELVRDGGGTVTGVVCETPGGRTAIQAGAVVLAAGGFEANRSMRREHLGERWELAHVRGTPFNEGEALRAALAAGAMPYGDWAGCHSTAWDVQSPPDRGNREITNLYTKQSYPLGIIVNVDGNRFVDEGADYRNYTYAKYGAAILQQPQARAFQLFDAMTEPLLRPDEYAGTGVSRLQGSTVHELAELIGVDPPALERTVREYNAAVQDGAFNPAVKDGKGTRGITPPKSNWALPLDTPPYLAFPVTCGITFTFGGVRIDAEARVLDDRRRPLPGLTAAGEMVGGLFYGNYPGGSGLSAGAVFGRRAGTTAARFAATSPGAQA